MVSLLLFFLLAIVIMAISVVLLYKAAQYLGIQVDRWAIVMCAVLALAVNFGAILVAFKMALSYVLVIAAFVIAAAAAVTGFNEYRIRKTQPAEALAEEAVEETTEELPAEETELPVEEPLPEEPATEELEEEAAAIEEPITEEPVIEEAPVDEPAPEVEVEPEPEVVEDEPEIVAEPELEVVEDEPEIAAEPEPEAVEEEPVIAAEPEPEVVEEEPEVEVEPEFTEKEPEIVVESEPEVVEAEGEPEIDSEPELEAVEDEPEVVAEPEPEVTKVEPEPEVIEEEPKVEPEPELPENLQSLDDYLDYAEAQKAAGERNAAAATYRKAITDYGDDPYAPFVVIELGNLYKETGDYDEAPAVYERALALSMLEGQTAIQAEFRKNIIYLHTVSHILKRHDVPNTQFREIPPDYLQEIETAFAEEQGRSNTQEE